MATAIPLLAGLVIRRTVNDVHEVLLVRYYNETAHEPHKWTVPGGNISGQLSDEEALRRKIWRQAGVRVQVETKHSLATIKYRPAGTEQDGESFEPTETQWFECRYVSEVESYQPVAPIVGRIWLPVDRLAELPTTYIRRQLRLLLDRFPVDQYPSVWRRTGTD